MRASAISFKGYKKSFGAHVVHRNINFSLAPGECLGLLGGSGAGKSVILRSIVGLERADAGEIWVQGEEVSRWPEEKLKSIRQKVAYVFQNGALFDSMSVYDNLAYSLREHTHLSEKDIHDRIMSLLNEFSLSGAQALFPASLSGGMQKRVGLARSIILEPPIVLYDEPTAGLDPYNTRRICDMMLRLKGRGVSSIFVTHDMASAFNVCDRIAILREGEIFASGRADEIQSQDPWIRSFIQGEVV